MPQIAKGGKFVFGWSIISQKGCVKIPEAVYQEYHLYTDDKVILISGSIKSRGFCVSNYTLMKRTVFNALFTDHPEIKDYSSDEGHCIMYKKRLYCWLKINPEGILRLPDQTMKSFAVKPGDRLLSIRGSNVAQVFALKGPIVTAAVNYEGIIDEYY